MTPLNNLFDGCRARLERLQQKIDAHPGEPALISELQAELDALADGLRQIEEQSRRSNDKPRPVAAQGKLISDTGADSILVYDREGILLSANQAAVRYLGFDPQHHSCLDIFQRLKIHSMGGAAVDLDETPIFRALQGERVEHEPYLFTNALGEISIVLVTADPLLVNGRVDGGRMVWRVIARPSDLQQVNMQLLAENQRQSKLLERIIYEAQLGIALLEGPEHRYTLVNLAFERLAHGRGCLIGRTVSEIWPEAVDTFVPLLDRVFQKGEQITRVDELFQLSGDQGPENRYFTFLIAPVHNEAELVDGVMIEVFETTEQVRIRQLSEDQRMMLKAIIENAPEGIVVVNEENRVIMTNPAADRIYARQIPYGQDYSDLSEFELRRMDGTVWKRRELPLSQAVFEGQTCTGVDMLVVRPGGEICPVIANAAPIRDVQGNIIGAVGLYQDVTERREIELENRRNAILVEVQHYLTNQREIERTQIARLLHDGPLQELIALTFSVEEAHDLLLGMPADEKIMGVQRALQRLIVQLRNIAFDLRPPMLSSFSLERTIRSHAENLSTKYPGLTVSLDMEPERMRLPEMLKVALFRIYQEAIDNIARHAGSSQAFVRLRFQEEQVRLEVFDNGAGFNVPEDWLEMAREGRLGLIGIRERVEAIGGRLELKSIPGEGTWLQVLAPYSPVEPLPPFSEEG